MMMNKTKQVLASDYWQNAPLQSVQDLMEMDTRDVLPEVDYIKALVKWGKAQVQLDGDDPENGEKL
jgi:hypothetical protein